MKKQVQKQVYNELTITKSKFLTYLFPISSLEETKIKLKEFKDKYSDSTHICYAYILDENTFKYYDDGEPASTAGAPIYQALKNNDLIYTMCVVIRYYGGTKLGVGGLIKAYTNSCLECLKISSLVTYQQLLTCELTTNYSNHEQIDYYLKSNNITIVNKVFDNQVIITISISEEQKEILENTFFNYIKLKNVTL